MLTAMINPRVSGLTLEKHTFPLLIGEWLNTLWYCIVVDQSISCVRLFVFQWTVACQVPLSMGFSKQECLSGLPFPSPVILYIIQQLERVRYKWNNLECNLGPVA